MSPDVMVSAFAWFSVALGIFTFLYRFIHPAFFRKLAMMQKVFGPGPGYALHFFAYTIVPIVIGAALLWSQHQAALAAGGV